MKLNLADRLLLRAVSPRHADYLADRLETRSRLFTPQVADLQGPGSGRQFLSWLRLVAHTVQSIGRAGGAAGCDAVSYERVDDGEALRARMLDRFAPGIAVCYVDRRSSLVRPTRPLRVLRLLSGVLGAIVISRFCAPSPLTAGYVHLARECLLVQGHATRTRKRRAYIYRMYQMRADIVAAFLMECGVGVHLVTHTGPLRPHLTRMLGTSVKFCSAYHIYEWQKYGPRSRVGDWELWGPQELPELEDRYRGIEFEDLPDVIGLYSQGYRLRYEKATVDRKIIEPYVELEAEIFETMRTYVERRPEVRLVLFPHPCERERFRQTGSHSYGSLLDHPRVTVEFESAGNSIMEFDEIGLGVTTFSTIGFDRLSLGLRTLFLVGDTDFVDWEVESPFHSLFVRDTAEFVRLMDEARVMSHAQFVGRYLSEVPAVTDVGPAGSQG